MWAVVSVPKCKSEAAKKVYLADDKNLVIPTFVACKQDRKVGKNQTHLVGHNKSISLMLSQLAPVQTNPNKN